MESWLRLGLVLFSILWIGCAPKPEETGSQESKRTTASVDRLGKPVTVLTDFDEPHILVVKTLFGEILGDTDEYHFVWKPLADEDPDDWDIALLRPWSISKVLDEAVDLETSLNRIYPKHRADFFVSIDQAKESQGKVLSVPVAIIADLLFARNQPAWNLTFNRDLLNAYIEKGGRIGVGNQPADEYYQKELGLPEDCWVEIDPDDPKNGFLEGEVDVAIGPRRWIVQRQIPGLSVHSLSDIGLQGKIPDSGYRFALSSESESRKLGEKILADLILDRQASLLGLGDSYPIRRSIYFSPRMQGAFLAVPRAPFDQTLQNLNAGLLER